MKDYIQRKVAEFKEIQKESFMTATAKPLLLQPEAVVWYEEILIETITQALAEERERVREYLNHYKTKSYCCSQTVDDIYTKYTKVMNDSKPFKHGEEGTHNVCNKHNIGGKSVCCECSGKDDCGDEPMKPSEIFEGENSSLKKTFDEAVAREQSYAEKQIDEIIEKVRTVEFLHGVPVTLPSETIELLRSGIRGAITQALAEERERVREEIEGRRLNPAKINQERLAEYHTHNDLINDLLSSLDKPLTDKDI